LSDDVGPLAGAVGDHPVVVVQFAVMPLVQV